MAIEFASSSDAVGLEYPFTLGVRSHPRLLQKPGKRVFQVNGRSAFWWSQSSLQSQESTRNWTMTSFFHHLVAGWAGPFENVWIPRWRWVGGSVKNRRRFCFGRQLFPDFHPACHLVCVLYPTLRISLITGALMTVNRL